MRFLLACGCVGSLLLGGCSLVSGLDQLDIPGDGGGLDPGKDAGADATVGPDTGTDAKPLDTGVDAPKEVGADAGCTATCPSGTACNGSFCAVPQGPACGAGASFNGSAGAVNGTVCTASSGPEVQTTCPSPINSPATFIDFSSGGDPWLVTVTAKNGPIQVQVMGPQCASAVSCTALASGASTTVQVGPGTAVAIVSVSGCSDWEATYQSK